MAKSKTQNAAPRGSDQQEQELGMSLTDIHMSVSRAFHTMNNSTRACARGLGLGQGQPRVLSYIAVFGVSTQREIAQYFSIDPSAVSRLLDPLERGGFLVSVPGRDRRARALDITEKGREALASWERECRRVDAIMTDGFTEDEVSQLKDMLERLRKNLAESLTQKGQFAKQESKKAPENTCKEATDRA